MLQFPAFMRQLPSPPLIPTSTLLPVAAHAQSDEDSLAVLESELEEKVRLFIPLPFSDPPLARQINQCYKFYLSILNQKQYPWSHWPLFVKLETLQLFKNSLQIINVVLQELSYSKNNILFFCFCVIHLWFPYLQWSEIRKTNSNLPVMGRKIVDSKEELDAGAEDDDVDNVGESEGDEFEQETG
ncbi:unnamed protein product [Musa hybrid cultivar]